MTATALTRLALTHFRSHRRLELHLDARPIAIHGANGSGKTNILEGVSLLSPGRGLRRAKTDEITRKPDGPGWKVSADIALPDNAHEIETFSEGGAARKVSIDAKTAPQTALAERLRMVWLIPAMDRLWIEGAEGRRRFLDRMTLSFVTSHATTVLSYDKAMRDRNRLLKDGVRDEHWYRALEAQMARAGAEIQDNRRIALGQISLAQQDAVTAFPNAQLRITGPDTTANDPQGEDALRQAWAEGRGADLAAGRTLTGPHRADLDAIYADKGVPARDCSTGEQKALLISLILSNARALLNTTGAPPLVLLDEVAAHLDKDRQAALYDEICALGVQAWMTGTGPELFETLGPRAQFVCPDPDTGAFSLDLA